VATEAPCVLPKRHIPNLGGTYRREPGGFVALIRYTLPANISVTYCGKGSAIINGEHALKRGGRERENHS